MDNQLDKLNSRFLFRAWDKRSKQMVKSGVQFNNSSMELVAIDDLVLMQCTSLKDKNGKFIYEGDIVTWKRKEPSRDTHYAVVFWDAMKAGFYLCPVHMYPRWIDYKSSIRQEFINGPKKEIIGNIYESPELLKQ